MTNYQIALMNPLGQNAFDRTIDRLFQDAVSASEAQGSPWTPASNAWEDEQGFYVQLALPGWESQDVTLEVMNQVLSIKGEHKQASPSGQTVHLQEIPDGRFMRVFKLPAFVDSQQASAVQTNGLLTVTFPKREEAKSRRIPIEGQ
ncbi:MAG: Hsp20/alpha crystallin family protein [Nitrospira sp.]